MKFSYRAFDKSGRAVGDTIEAANAADARESLSRQGLFVTEISAPNEFQVTHVKSSSGVFGKKKRLSNVAMFTRQLFVLVSSGTPIVGALQTLERQAKDLKWRGVVVRLRVSVEEGASLSTAMDKHPDYFDSICRSLVAAGEQGGRLKDMLDRLAMLTRKQLQVRSAISGAMVYPCLLALIASSVLIVMLTFVLPRFAGLFETLDVPLPPTTKMLMVVSDILIHYWWALIIGIAGAIFGFFTWMKTPGGKRALDSLVVQLPIFGPMVQSFATARIARLLGVQFDSHVPMLEALKLTKQACNNVVYADLIAKAEDAATSGQSIATAFAGSKLINPAMCEAIRNGEASGQLGTLLINIAEFMEEENEIVIKSLTSIIEPIILIVLGALVGLVAVSLFLPLFDLTAMAQGGG